MVSRVRVEGWYRGLVSRVRVEGWYRGLGLGLVSRVGVRVGVEVSVGIEGWC